MTEILYFEITAFYRNNEPVPNSSCTFILGSESIDSPIPTEGPIKIQTTRLEDTESLLVLFKQNEDIVAKATSSLWSLRNAIGLDFRLESLNNTGFHSTHEHYSWDHSYRILREDNTKVESFTKNPFREQALHADLGSPLRQFETKQGLGTFVTLGASSQNLSPLNYVEPHEKTTSFEANARLSSSLSPNQLYENLQTKATADYYINELETKLAQSVHLNASLTPEINNLLTSLKSSIRELEKPQATTNIETILASSQKQHGSIEEDYSPKFGKPITHGSSPGNLSAQRVLHEGSFSNKKEIRSDLIHQGTSPVKEINTWAVDEEAKENAEHRGTEFYQVREEEYQQDDDEDNLFLEDVEGQEIEEEDSGNKADTMGSIVDEIKIDRNQEYLFEIKNQLGIKALTNLSDGFTRELVMQMSRGKKKICAVRLKKAVKLRNNEVIEIEPKSYFRDSGDKKFLHFFQPYTKYLYLFNLNRHFDIMDEKPLQITLDIDFDISPHYKSVITPSGLIFIVSGKAQTSAPDLDDSTGSLHVYHYNGQTLIEKPSMSASRRKQFGLCYMSKNLFVVGGIVDGIISNYCERFDVRSNEWLELAPMNKKLKDISVCSFNSRYIYRYFGVNAMNMTDNSIERYDAVRDKWTLMNVVIPELLREVHMPLCTQISQETIFIFGGRTSAGYPSKSNKGFVMKIEDKRRSNNAEIHQTKNFVSGLAGNFSQNNMLAHEGDILFLRESY